jgi:hypothetical protein
MSSHLVITNSDAAVGRLIAGGVQGEMLPWWDVLYNGPLPMASDLPAFSKVRADYIKSQQWAFSRLSHEQFMSRDALIARNEDFDAVSLWFEHDLNDQLQLCQVLDWFAANPRPEGTLFLVQSNMFIDEMDEDEVAAAASMATPVTEGQFRAAQMAWNAIRQPNPEYWAYLLQMDLSALPFLPAAVLRMLEELPDTQTGLSRSERQVLQILRKKPAEPRQLYKAHWRLEEAGYMDDWSLFALLDRMHASPRQLFTGKADVPFNPNMGSTNWRRYVNRKLEISKLGFMVVEGHEDTTAHGQVDRRWGGTHILSKNLWRWNTETNALVAPVR